MAETARAHQGETRRLTRCKERRLSQHRRREGTRMKDFVICVALMALLIGAIVGPVLIGEDALPWSIGLAGFYVVGSYAAGKYR
jgi:hypothetical protein